MASLPELVQTGYQLLEYVIFLVALDPTWEGYALYLGKTYIIPRYR